MIKIYTKIIAMALALLMSISVVIVASYAWLVLSGNPVATGIQVTIGGGNTILTAPNMQETVNGKVYHYPGVFSDKLNFGQQKSYEFLKSLGSLTPVSTYNGIDWFLPTYYSGADALVQEGSVPGGTLKDISEFQIDSTLTYANLSAEEKEKIEEGSYIYLDFWVVSPGGDFTLRISTGDEAEDGGSFVVDLLQPLKTETGCVLTAPASYASSIVRVGFLANDIRLTDDTMLHYKNSIYYDDRFTSLRGLYMDPKTGAAYLASNRFTIYEPNGDVHPTNAAVSGTYVQTKPLALENGETVEKSVRDRLSVQLGSTWVMSVKGLESTEIEQRFQTAVMAKNTAEMEESEIADYFYRTYLQGQLSPYISKGRFLSSTTNLYSYLNMNGGAVSAQQLGEIETAGAVDDVYIIKLERNVPQRIRMFIWLEGQDVDCTEALSFTQFAVNIELAGGSE